MKALDDKGLDVERALDGREMAEEMEKDCSVRIEASWTCACECKDVGIHTSASETLRSFNITCYSKRLTRMAAKRDVL